MIEDPKELVEKVVGLSMVAGKTVVVIAKDNASVLEWQSRLDARLRELGQPYSWEWSSRLFTPKKGGWIALRHVKWEQSYRGLNPDVVVVPLMEGIDPRELYQLEGLRGEVLKL